MEEDKGYIKVTKALFETKARKTRKEDNSSSLEEL